MAKRSKNGKAEREAAEKAALNRRLADMAAGAYGDYSRIGWFNEDEFSGMAAEMGLDAFGRWLGAIKNELLKEEQHWLVRPSVLGKFDYLSTATDWLYENDVRA